MDDSAGGGLLLLTIQSLIAQNLPVPKALLAMSPWTDSSSSGNSYKRNEQTDVILSPENLQWWTDLILTDTHSEKEIDTQDPLYSSMFGLFKYFPPPYLIVGTAELLEDESRTVYEKAKNDGVDVTSKVGEHLLHGYPLLHLYYPEGEKTLRNVKKWMNLI